MKTKTLLPLLVISLLSACATTQKLSTIERETITSREYVGITKDQLMLAGEELFHLADGDDFIITHSHKSSSHERLYAKRNWRIYFVLGWSKGTDYWLLTADSNEKGVKATMQVNRKRRKSYTMMPDNSKTASMQGEPINGTAIYDIFWARIDYLLGKRQDWMTCKISDDRINQKIVWGENDALCDSVTMKDSSPKSPIVSRVQPNTP